MTAVAEALTLTSGCVEAVSAGKRVSMLTRFGKWEGGR